MYNIIIIYKKVLITLLCSGATILIDEVFCVILEMPECYMYIRSIKLLHN